MTIENTILQAIQSASSEKPVNNAGLRLAIAENHGEFVHERKIRTVIRNLREAGHPILAAKSSGYFFAESLEQIEDYQKTLFNHAKSEMRTVSLMKKQFKKFNKQMALFSAG